MNNKIMNKYYEMARQYHAMAIDAAVSSMKGFRAFFMNESEERWKSGKKVEEYLLMHMKNPAISAVKAPVPSFENPMAALDMAINMENELIAMLDNPSEYAGKAQYELAEIVGIKKLMKIPGATIWDIDRYLHEEYGG